MSKKLHIKTYGCQMNVYDSLKMQELLAPFGYTSTDNQDEADMFILNTCHIREKASEKMYSELGRIKQIKDTREREQSSKTIIAVAGCVGQAEGEEIFKRSPYVDIVVGPQSYHTLPDLIGKLARAEKHLIELDFIEEEKFDNLPETREKQGASAFVSVQEGCDKFCTFCVVPYTRGAEFSRPVEQVYRESMMQVSLGAKEIHLLGQNVNAYHGQGVDKDYNLADLIRHLSTINGLERIRYTTSHPKDMTDDLIKLHGQEQKLMPFLHLPIQSGSNKILKAMNRKHTREEYFTIIDKLRMARPDIALSSDFIVGFPGETDADFEDTMDLVKKIKYSQCYSFKYSARPGTPAASMQMVPEKVRTQRLEILQQELSKQQLEFNESSVGKVFPVLFEKIGKNEGDIVGKTPYMQSAYVTGADKSLIGNIVNVKIIRAQGNSLAGEIA
ncbi:MAG: tRNA (N6-isopentenyl adenosine(37)-C2)-methylthiotransferase MiaB [Rickettsiales bacterium]|nr:tRNA (N6-isopentenyl adenosine(37)-C2)-methylthiotransferase MiaB [Rickettsiales bacterium]